MSRASSPSSGRRYGTARVCQLWEVPRSTVYARRARASRPAQPAAKRGPKGAGTDAALTERIRAVLARSPFIGEGYRKAWARLCLAGVRTSKGRVLRLMRAAGLLAPTRVGRRRGPRNHDGTITTDRPDELWGTDATACLTTREGNATVFIAVDHCTQQCVGIHAARPGTRFEALEPLRQGLRAHHGGYGPGVAAGLSLRHDHGSQYLSDHFQGELRFLGIRSSPSFVAAPGGNGCAERFIRTLKEPAPQLRQCYVGAAPCYVAGGVEGTGARAHGPYQIRTPTGDPPPGHHPSSGGTTCYVAPPDSRSVGVGG